MVVKAQLYDVDYFIFPDEVGTLDQIPADLTKIYLLDEDKYQYHAPVIQNAVKKAVGKEQNVYWIVRNILIIYVTILYYERVGG